MQETRQQILTILREREVATVEQIVTDLEKIRGSITSVTVRHHLNKLQKRNLIYQSETLSRSSPGRPQHLYQLTELGHSSFPNNYQQLTINLLKQLEATLPEPTVNVILEGVAKQMTEEAMIADKSFEQKLDSVVEYFNSHGYDAQWNKCDEGYILITANCPYYNAAHKSDHLCRVDMRLVANMLGIVPQLRSRIAEGGNTCEYLLPTPREK